MFSARSRVADSQYRPGEKNPLGLEAFLALVNGFSRVL